MKTPATHSARHPTRPNHIGFGASPLAGPGPGDLAGSTRREFLGLSLLAAAGAAAAPAFAAMGGLGGLGGLPQLGQSAAFQWTDLRGEGVWAVLGGGGNAMLAISGDEALLVDTKLATHGATLQREATARAPITMIINTHHHADHSGGNFAFDDPRLIAHEKAEPRIRSQIERYMEQLRGLTPDTIRATAENDLRTDLERVRERIDELDQASWAPRETVDGDRAKWTLAGETPVEARHFGAGHTDNDMVIFLPRQNILHAGDLLFHQMHPFFDPDGGGTCAGWIESVEAVRSSCAMTRRSSYRATER